VHGTLTNIALETGSSKVIPTIMPTID
jgi:hypothetical protein